MSNFIEQLKRAREQKVQAVARLTAQFGLGVIEEARRRLCDHCQGLQKYPDGTSECATGLIPLTTDGGDCPYWRTE